MLPSSEQQEESPLSWNEHDVFLGRGGGTNQKRHGSLYRKLILKHFEEYLTLSPKQKREYALEKIIHPIIERGGSFLIFDRKTKGWETIMWKAVASKVMQALRDCKRPSPVFPLLPKESCDNAAGEEEDNKGQKNVTSKSDEMEAESLNSAERKEKKPDDCTAKNALPPFRNSHDEIPSEILFPNSEVTCFFNSMVSEQTFPADTDRATKNKPTTISFGGDNSSKQTCSLEEAEASDAEPVVQQMAKKRRLMKAQREGPVSTKENSITGSKVADDCNIAIDRTKKIEPQREYSGIQHSKSSRDERFNTVWDDNLLELDLQRELQTGEAAHPIEHATHVTRQHTATMLSDTNTLNLRKGPRRPTNPSHLLHQPPLQDTLFGQPSNMWTGEELDPALLGRGISQEPLESMLLPRVKRLEGLVCMLMRDNENMRSALKELSNGKYCQI